MAKSSEEISKYNANSGGKTDSNIANDALHLGGIPAEEYATQKYVQDYHNNKEALQKEYIDKQDQAKLEEAKAYADQIVTNQDFSDFAKLTDVQAVDTKLTEKINTDIANQKQYTDQEIKKVVEDVNTNFDQTANKFKQVDTNIKNLDTRTNELFQSVSSGKGKIAEAITDKGVVTSANDAFDTMAGNIRKIETGGGEIPPGYVDTSDATAKNSDILIGKTAYANGEKIYGTLIAEAEQGMPTYGTDTSDATATASDIAYGKTAYARGQLLVGNAAPGFPVDGGSSESTFYGVEELYTATDVNFDFKRGSVRLIKEADSEDTVVARRRIAFSKDNKYCVSVAYLNETTNQNQTDFVIDSFQVTEDGMVINATNTDNGVKYKKYRYTKEELGLDENEYVVKMEFGAAGFSGRKGRCILAILTYNTSESKNYLHFYTYQLTDNGVIGRMYNNETDIIFNYTVCVDDYQSASVREKLKFQSFTFANLNPNVFFVVSNAYDSSYYFYNFAKFELKPNNSNGELSIFLSREAIQQSDNRVSQTLCTDRIIVSKDDSYITNADVYWGNQNASILIKLSPDLLAERFATFFNANTFFSGLFIPEKNIYLQVAANRITDGGYNFYIYNIEPKETYGFTFNKLKTVKGKYDENSSKFPFGQDIITEDGKQLISLTGKGNSGYNAGKNLGIAIFNIDDILNADASSIVYPKKTEDFDDLMTTDQTDDLPQIISNFDNTDIKIVYNSQINSTHIEDQCFIVSMIGNGNKSLIGIRYKNEFYSRAKANILTAGQPDVRKGKTFIGWQGYPETGTMEV